jgi:hypothetical protein
MGKKQSAGKWESGGEQAEREAMKRAFDWVRAEGTVRVLAHGGAALIFLLAAFHFAERTWLLLEFGALSVISVWLGWIQWKLTKRKSAK